LHDLEEDAYGTAGKSKSLGGNSDGEIVVDLLQSNERRNLDTAHFGHIESSIKRKKMEIGSEIEEEEDRI